MTDRAFEADINVDNGVIYVSFSFDDSEVRFCATPSKLRTLIEALSFACDEADKQMPSL